MIAGDADAPCPADEAWRYAQQIPTMANFVTLEGGDHGVFAWYAGDDYVNLLTRELTSESSTQVNRESLALSYEGLEEWYGSWDSFGGKDSTSDEDLLRT